MMFDNEKDLKSQNSMCHLSSEAYLIRERAFEAIESTLLTYYCLKS